MAASKVKRMLRSNGAYSIEQDADNKYIGVYLKSPVVYEEQRGKPVRSTMETRAFADVEFVLVETEDAGWEVAEMNVAAINQHGVNEFVVAMLSGGILPRSEEKVVALLDKLLEQAGAPWGQFHQDVKAKSR